MKLMQSDTSLYIASVIVFFISYLIIIYLSLSNPDPPNINPIQIKCQVGQCRLNNVTGEKECFESGESEGIVIDPRYYTCSEPYSCPARTYPLLSDGSTSTDGLCEKGTICNCLPRPQCPTNVTGTFKASNGTVNTVLPGYNTTFSVSTVYSQYDGTKMMMGPIQYDPKVELCSIPYEWIQNGRTYLWGDECPFGTLAFIDNNKRQLSCVAGSIECDTYPILVNGRLVCDTVP